MIRSRRPAEKLNVNEFEDAFLDFLDHVVIVSKDHGRIPFRFFNVQKVLHKGIFDGLRDDIHYFVELKARQLGSTTYCRLLQIFWNGIFPGLQSAIVAQDQPSIKTIRFHIEDVIDNLPITHQLPMPTHNRDGVVFETPGGRSTIDYLIAGTKQQSGNLGRSRSYNCALCTEVSSYGDVEGFESLKNTFSDVFLFRLYILESTARGFNLFHDEWEEAGEDDLTKRQIFLAWWMHEQYQYRSNTRLFARYGYPELTPEEKEISAEVYRLFGHRITLEQWAWYRHRKDPRSRDERDSVGDEREELVEQEFPSYPEQAFLETGSPFIHGRYITPILKEAEKMKYLGLRYQLGDSVLTSRRLSVNTARLAQLRVFQEPVDGATYIVACDPAFSENEESDNSVIQVFRCWADQMHQVAIFCTRGISTAHLAWVLIDLCGWYGNCRYVIEINGQGANVYLEFVHLKRELEAGRLALPRDDPGNPTDDELKREGMTRSMLGRVRTYLYSRFDTIGAGFNLHWQTSPSNKERLMVRYADRIILNEIRLNCVDTIRETKNLRREGGTIEAEGKKKDDRAVASALAVECWMSPLTGVRSEMLASGRTYAAETSLPQDGGEGVLAASNYMSSLWRGEIRGKQKAREAQQRWGSRGGRWAW